MHWEGVGWGGVDSTLKILWFSGIGVKPAESLRLDEADVLVGYLSVKLAKVLLNIFLKAIKCLKLFNKWGQPYLHPFAFSIKLLLSDSSRKR